VRNIKSKTFILFKILILRPILSGATFRVGILEEINKAILKTEK